MAAAEAAALRELLPFLRPESRGDLKSAAVGLVSGLTGVSAGVVLLASVPEAVSGLVALLGDPAVGEEASRAVANLAAEPAAHPALRPAMPALLRRPLSQPGHPLAALHAAALANLARQPHGAHLLLRRLLQGQAGGMPALIDALCHHQPALATLLANLTQLTPARQFLLHPHRGAVQRLLPYTQDAASSVRRAGVVRTLRNCCLDYGHHEWLLSDQVDVLPFLLLPLAGPEEFPEDEMESLPLDLQYLPPEKQREPDPDIRKMLLEALLLLTATKPGRQTVRQKGTYFILRELHKWETDPGVLAACEKVVQVLIGDEPEPGMENLLEVEIPAEIEEQLQRLDREEEPHEETPSGSQAPQG